MSTHYRSLLVVIILAGIGLLIAQRVFSQLMLSDEDYRRRRNLWMVLTISAFVLPSFWAYAAFAAVAILYTARLDSNPVALFPLLLVAIPPVEAVIPSLFSLTHQRLLVLVLLVPLIPRLLRDPRLPGMLRLPVDKFVLGFCLLQLVLMWPYITGPHILRLIVLMLLDTWIPYYVISRVLSSRDQVRDAMACFVLTLVIFVPLAMAEVRLGTLLYGELSEHWGVSGIFNYLTRGDLMRAQLASGQAIVLGYQFAVSIGLWLYLQRRIASRFWRSLGALALVIGLLAPISRGPWLGAASILVAFVLFAPKGLGRAASWGALALVVLGVLSLTPLGPKLANYLPFVGDVAHETVDYRAQILAVSWELIKVHPFFGDPTVTSQLELLRTGEGIIDIVNVYVSFALSYGLVGVAIFVGMFVSAMLPLARVARNPLLSEDSRYMAATLLATLVGVLVMISSVSNYLTIPAIYLMVIGFAVSGARVLERDTLVLDSSMDDMSNYEGQHGLHPLGRK